MHWGLGFLGSQADDDKGDQGRQDREHGSKGELDAAEPVQGHKQHADYSRCQGTFGRSLFPEYATDYHDQGTGAQERVGIGQQLRNGRSPQSEIQGQQAGHKGNDLGNGIQFLLITVSIRIDELQIDIVSHGSRYVDELGVHRTHNSCHQGRNHNSPQGRRELFQEDPEDDAAPRRIGIQSPAIHTDEHRQEYEGNQDQAGKGRSFHGGLQVFTRSVALEGGTGNKPVQHGGNGTHDEGFRIDGKQVEVLGWQIGTHDVKGAGRTHINHGDQGAHEDDGHLDYVRHHNAPLAAHGRINEDHQAAQAGA